MRHRNQLAGLACALALLLAAVPAGAARRKEIVLRMYEIGCTAPDPARRAALPADWLAHQAQVEHCPVLTADGRHVLTVETVHVPRGGTPPAPLPPPRLLDLSGRVVGVLPGVWPGPDPELTFLYFKRWRDDFPWRIELLALHTTEQRLQVGRTGYPPLVWNPTRRQYETGK